MLRSFFEEKLYVRVGVNQFEIDNLSTGTSTVISAADPFTTRRLLVGEFSCAESQLREGIRRAQQPRLFRRTPAVVIHPVEMIEDGLSQVESRLFIELVQGAGARRFVLWTGNRLSPRQALEKLDEA